MNTRELISILMESSLYQTLTIKEKNRLVSSLAEQYPFLAEGKEDETAIGYESSWPGSNQSQSR